MTRGKMVIGGFRKLASVNIRTISCSLAQSARALPLLSLGMAACASPRATPPGGQSIAMAAQPVYRVVVVDDLKWEQLNPARGDQSPKAADLWGDRKGDGPTGYLLKPVDGFRSPPHVHNVSYRGLVIRGRIHNDDPRADTMWMPAGSFWTQPKGAVHVTAAKGVDTLAYVEIDQGPYLVRPVDKAFQSGERPLNLHPSNIVWVDASRLGWQRTGTPATAKGVKVAFLWGDPDDQHPSGTLLKLPADWAGKISALGAALRAIVIQGQPKHLTPGETNAKTLRPGSYFGSKGRSLHYISTATGECVIYLRVAGDFDVVRVAPES